MFVRLRAAVFVLHADFVFVTLLIIVREVVALCVRELLFVAELLVVIEGLTVEEEVTVTLTVSVIRVVLVIVLETVVVRLVVVEPEFDADDVEVLLCVTEGVDVLDVTGVRVIGPDFVGVAVGLVVAERVVVTVDVLEEEGDFVVLTEPVEVLEED